MALVTLCKVMNWPMERWMAFVVDHKARDGSGLEALKVKSALAKLGTSDQTSELQ